jgi:endonuclease YncB( thermonuclease family)
MPKAAAAKRAPATGALFVCLALLATAVAACGGVAETPACAADRIDEEVRVAYVNDGDTVTLTDGRLVRLIGVDTPELDHRGGRSEAYAEAAREALARLLEPSRRVGLRYDRERRDRYRRQLAHVYLADGRNAEAELLAQGLGVALLIPPNGWQSGCYLEVERQARSRRLGIWTLPRYRPASARRLERDANGFRLVRGRVTGVHRTPKSLTLTLDAVVEVFIAGADLRYFEDYDPGALSGRRVTVRGWVHPRHGRPQLRVRHPAALDLD